MGQLRHVMFTYKGKFKQANKNWSVERFEKVLKRIGAKNIIIEIAKLKEI